MKEEGGSPVCRIHKGMERERRGRATTDVAHEVEEEEHRCKEAGSGHHAIGSSLRTIESASIARACQISEGRRELKGRATAGVVHDAEVEEHQ